MTLPVIVVRPSRPRAWDVGKRLFDISATLCLLPFAVPILVITGVLISRETPGGAIFRQTRIGRAGRAFTIYKLRTMVQNADQLGAGIYAERNDPRFTRVGTFARRYSLDELPQLFNVLLGQMSLVGPRPMLGQTVIEYADDYGEILQVKPGITGLSQVSGRNALPRSERLALDRAYVRQRSLMLDLRILFRTIGVALTGEGQLNSQSRADVER